MRNAVFFAVCLPFFITAAGLCGEASSGTDAVIAVSFKTLAKALVGQDGIKRLSDRIEAMDEAEFSARYREAYEMIASVPGLQSSYGLKEDMTRKEVLEVLRTWDGRKVCALIDSIPDSRIRAKFDEYLAYAQEHGAGTDPFKQIQVLWGRVISELRVK